jgi:2-hydroxyacyl-CoA lyase 1
VLRCPGPSPPSPASQAWGYLTGWPAACLAVSGPGVLHCIGGLANAKENCWPMVLLGGACDSNFEGASGALHLKHTH